MGEAVKGVRVVLMAAVLANLAVLVVTQHVQATRVRYHVARRQTELRSLSAEQRALSLRRADARKPENVERRARELGVDVRREKP